MRGTFSSRVGQICNAALDRSIIAYNENSDAEERKRLQDETEVLAILTGLEIDSAKSGIRPDLDEYLKKRRVRRTPFLQYKNLVEDAEETRRAWYEETHQQRIKAFFQKNRLGQGRLQSGAPAVFGPSAEKSTRRLSKPSPPGITSSSPSPSSPIGRNISTGKF